MYQFQLIHFDRTGNKKGLLPYRLLKLSLGKYSGSLTLDVTEKQLRRNGITFTDYDVIIVYWRNLELGIVGSDGRAWVKLEVFIYREKSVQTNTRNQTSFQLRCINKWGILNWRTIDWPNGESNRSLFQNVAPETIGKTLVTYNFTSAATVANDRWSEGDLAATGFTLTVAGDQARGTLRNYNGRNGRVLQAIVRLAKGSDGEFTLTQSGDAYSWRFDFKLGQQGEDKFDTVIFSLDRKNIVRPKLVERKMARPTRLTVLGGGEGEARLHPQATHSDYAASNDIQGSIDARDVGNDTVALVDRGGDSLEQLGPQVDLSFEVKQTTNTFLSNVAIPKKLTYWLGDITQANYAGQSFRMEVSKFDIIHDGVVPKINIDMAVVA